MKLRGKNQIKVYATIGSILIFIGLVFVSTNSFYLNILFTIFMFAGISSAWNIIGGFAGQLSLGHSAFYGLGAYTCGLLLVKLGIPPILGIWASIILASLLAIIIGYPCFRLRGPFFTLATIAVGEVLLILAVNMKTVTAGSEGLSIPFHPSLYNLSFQTKTPYALLGLLFMLISLSAAYIIKKTRLGYELVALRDEDQAAESLGVNTTRAKIVALIISAAITALGGGIYAQYVLFLEPHSEFSLATSVNFAMISMVGGLGTLMGPVIGAFILIPLQEFLRAWLGGASQGLYFFIYGVLLILVVMFMPQGIIHFCARPFNKLMQRFSLPEEEFPSHIGTLYEARQVLTKNKQLVTNDMPNEEILKVESVSKRFGGITAVNNVSLSVRKGEILGIIGPNGAGKSTLFNLLSGVYKPDSGLIIYNGITISEIHKSHIICRLGIGRTFQIVKPFENITVLENVMVGSFCRTNSVQKAKRLALELISIAGLMEKKDYICHSLTLADKKRLEVARALATQPTILLLDEVMAGLTTSEVEEAIKWIRMIRELGITIIVVEHVMQAIMSLSDRIMVMAEGKKIAEGPPAEIIHNPLVIKAYLGDEYETPSA